MSVDATSEAHEHVDRDEDEDESEGMLPERYADERAAGGQHERCGQREDGEEVCKSSLGVGGQRHVAGEVDAEQRVGSGLSGGFRALLAGRERARGCVGDRIECESEHEAGWPSLPSYPVQTGAVAVLSGDRPPTSLLDLVPRIAPRSVLLIGAGSDNGGEDLQPHYFAAAKEPKAFWRVPEAVHTSGFAARPREYARRLTEFFGAALLAPLPNAAGALSGVP